MKKPSISALCMLAALAFACASCQQKSASPLASPSSADIGTAEVHAAADLRLKAIETGDVESYLSVYAEDAVWMPPASAMEIVGKDAARRRISQAFETTTFKPVIQSREQTLMSPDWIANRGQYSIIVTPKGGSESRQEVGSFMTLWHRDTEGEWKIYFDIWNTDRPILDLGEAK